MFCSVVSDWLSSGVGNQNTFGIVDRIGVSLVDYHELKAKDGRSLL